MMVGAEEMGSVAEEAEFPLCRDGVRCCVVGGVVARVRWSRMVSVLGFVTWSPVHLTVGISTTKTLFKF